MDETQFDSTGPSQEMKIYGTEKRHPWKPPGVGEPASAGCVQIIRGRDGKFHRCGRGWAAAVHIDGADIDTHEDPELKRIIDHMLSQMEVFAVQSGLGKGRRGWGDGVGGWAVWLHHIKDRAGRLDKVAMFPGWKRVRINCLVELAAASLSWAAELQAAELRAAAIKPEE
jgi:hypothetical protein